jgi:predicted transcriptional regulator
MIFLEQIKLFDSELRLMEILWERAPVTAKVVSLIAAEQIGWN